MEPTPHDAAPSRRDELAVAGIAAIVHGASVRNGYSLDDGPALLFHPAVNGEAPVWEAFTREFWGEPLETIEWGSSYRPITTLTFGLEHGLTSAPWLHHLVNLLLYVVVCVAVLRVGRRWLAPPFAVAAAVGFAVLPVHVENVASLVGRADVLAALFGLFAFEAASPRSGEPPSWSRSGAAGVLALLGILCKETLAPLIGVIAWFALLAALRTAPSERRRWLRAPLLVATFTAAYLVVRQRVLPIGLPPDFVPAQNQLILVSGVARVWANLALVGEYAELVFVPLRLCPDHTYADVVPITSPFEPGGWRIAIGLLFAGIVGRDAVHAVTGRAPGLWVATALAYLLVGQWVTNLNVILGERLVFWPSIWLIFALANGAERLELPSESRRRLVIPLAALAVVFSVRSAVRTLDWYDNVTLHRAAVEACPASVHSRLILANELRDRGDAEEAVWHYGVAGAGRSTFPRRFEVPAFTAEQELPLDERLRRLPELVNVPDERAFWVGLHRYLVVTGAQREAAVVEGIVREALRDRADVQGTLEQTREADPWRTKR